MDSVYSEASESEDETPECASCRLKRLGVGSRVVEENRNKIYASCKRHEQWLVKYGHGKKVASTLPNREKLCAFWREAKRKFDQAFPPDIPSMEGKQKHVKI